MTYGPEAYWGDRELMEFEPLVRLYRDTILRKRKRLAVDEIKRDMVAIDAACERLLAWRASGDPEPKPPRRKDDPAPDPAEAEPAPVKPDQAQPFLQSEAEKAAWAQMLNDQQNRHHRRRQAYPHVRPVPLG